MRTARWALAALLAAGGGAAVAQEAGEAGAVPVANRTLAREGRDGPRDGAAGRWGARSGAGEAGVPGLGSKDALLERLLEAPRVAEELGLTSEQLGKLREGSLELRKRQIELRADLEKAGLEQARLLTGERVDESALMAAVEKSGQLRTELAKVAMRQLLLVKATLTPAQMEKAHERARGALQKRHEAARPGAGGGMHGAERAGAPPPPSPPENPGRTP